MVLKNFACTLQVGALSERHVLASTLLRATPLTVFALAPCCNDVHLSLSVPDAPTLPVQPTHALLQVGHICFRSCYLPYLLTPASPFSRNPSLSTQLDSCPPPVNLTCWSPSLVIVCALEYEEVRCCWCSVDVGVAGVARGLNTNDGGSSLH